MAVTATLVVVLGGARVPIDLAAVLADARPCDRESYAQLLARLGGKDVTGAPWRWVVERLARSVRGAATVPIDFGPRDLAALRARVAWLDGVHAYDEHRRRRATPTAPSAHRAARTTSVQTGDQLR